MNRIIFKRGIFALIFLVFSFCNTSFAEDTSNEKISVSSGLEIAEKAFGREKISAVKLDEYYFRGDYSRTMTYETAAEILLKANDIMPITKSDLWNLKQATNGFNRYTNTLYILGYKTSDNKQPISYLGVSEAEFDNMISFMLSYTGGTISIDNDISITPDFYSDLSNLEKQLSILNTKTAVKNVPDKVLNSFIDNGFKISVLSAKDWEKCFDKRTVGMYSHAEKTIYVRYGYEHCLVHEMGHFIHFMLADNDYFISSKALNEQKKQLATLKSDGDTYYLTNDTELFAEMFEEYCLNGGIREKSKRLFDFMDNTVKTFYNIT